MAKETMDVRKIGDNIAAGVKNALNRVAAKKARAEAALKSRDGADLTDVQKDTIAELRSIIKAAKNAVRMVEHGDKFDTANTVCEAILSKANTARAYIVCSKV